jgi:hypothetical protein
MNIMRCLLLTSLAWGAGAGLAETPQPTSTDASTQAIWVNLGGISWHDDRRKGYNENNGGLGLEYPLQADIALMGGAFHNSVHKTSGYVAIKWQPLTLGDWKLGLSTGVMNGYPGIHRGGAFLAALPMASYEGSRFGVNLALVPYVDRAEGALAIQFKFRLR